MRLLGWLGLILMGGGALLRERYYSEANLIWVNEAYRQGAETLGNGAPMNYFHQDWPVPLEASAQGWIGIAAMIVGAVLIGLALARVKQ